MLVVIFYFVVAAVIPGYTKRKIAPIGTVQPWAFTNQDGRIMTEKDAMGKISAVNFFFTTCKGVCPIMNNNVKTVYEAFRKEPDFLIFSFTSDPGTDSVPRLKRYSDSMAVDTQKWMFLTGRKDSLYAAARHSFRIDNPQNFVTKIEDDFIHTQFIALVNRKGEVVHIYDGIKPSEMREMEADIKRLLKE